MFTHSCNGETPQPEARSLPLGYKGNFSKGQTGADIYCRAGSGTTKTACHLHVHSLTFPSSPSNGQ